MNRAADSFVKRYADPQRCAAAYAHLRWLDGLNSGVRLPFVRSASADQLVFEDLGHQRAGPEHLAVLADALARLHVAAHQRHLHAAQLDQPFSVPEGLVIPDFVSVRHDALRRVHIPLAGLAAAFYKDANIRNFLLIDDEIAVVDFDDLTLAPFGYDLAKLLVSTAMTHGAISERDVRRVLDAYNDRVGEANIAGAACTMNQVRIYTEMHHTLTAAYLHRNGYRYPWPSVRPWPAPKQTTSPGKPLERRTRHGRHHRTPDRPSR